MFKKGSSYPVDPYYPIAKKDSMLNTNYKAVFADMVATDLTHTKFLVYSPITLTSDSTLVGWIQGDV